MPLPEKKLIADIRRMAGSLRQRPSGLLTGIGDDCAILRPSPGYDFVITTDFSLEDVHFRRDWHPPESVGHRCLARGLSDIAAMGGEPVAAFLSLALPPDVPQSWVTRFMRGLLRLAETHKTSLAGGDTAQSPDGILADIIVVGRAPKTKSIQRSGAKPGDKIYVSGALGGAAAALNELTQAHSPRRHPERSRSSGGAKDLPLDGSAFSQGAVFSPGKTLNPRDYPRHFYPEPRLNLGRVLREKRLATAMIDLSDGLSTDLAHICEESGVGAEIESERIPRAKIGKPPREVDLDLALHGGEDYELLFTVPTAKRIPGQIGGITLTCIGQITRQRKLLLADENGKKRRLIARGWEHFRR